MIQNKKFAAYAAAFGLLCAAFSFLCAVFAGGQFALIRTFVSAANGGWSEARIETPFVLGAFLSVPLAFVCGGFFRKYGIRPVLILGLGASALSCVGLAAANGTDVCGGADGGFYPLFLVSLILTYGGGIVLSLSSAALCVRWCLRKRGLALGCAALGFPLFLIFRGSLTALVAGRLAGDYRAFYLGAAAVLAVLAALSRVLLADWPEDAGLYPDGEGEAPVTEPEEEAPVRTPSEILADRRVWPVILSGGVFCFLAAVCGTAAMFRPDTVHPMLLIVLGLLCAYGFGRMDDTIGTAKSMTVLGCFALLAVLGLWLAPGTAAAKLFLTLGFGGLLGGVPVMRPCGTAFLYGRRSYTDADRVIAPVQLLFAAFSGVTARGVLSNGRVAVCLVMTAAAALALFCTVSLREITDANADDRGY